MSVLVHEFATKPALLRRALELHQRWLEEKLRVPFSETVILETDVDLTEIAIERLLSCSGPQQTKSRTLSRLRPLLISAEVPNSFPPLLEINNTTSSTSLRAALLASTRDRRSTLAWKDCPIAFHLKGIEGAIIAINVAYHAGPDSDCESDASLLVVRRNCAAQVVRLIDGLKRPDRQPRLQVMGGSSRRIVGCGWDDLVLDQSVLSLLRDDFESFFKRESWFRKNRLPFRRGYLLHGPPGNGKSTAIRAMMTSRGLTAYTLRWFDRRQDDGDLERLFDQALNARPSIVLLEDLDRAFPKTGETKSGMSLQQLLNCLDGVGTGEGVIVVATANEPTILDPAILRRPGRFDRVIHFANPEFQLRQSYFRRMHPGLETVGLEQVAFESEGFSFAQLREAYISAGQRAFERKGEIREDDLVSGIRSLRRSLLTGSSRSNAAGFQATPEAEVTA
jgi:hypothetical protein